MTKISDTTEISDMARKLLDLAKERGTFTFGNYELSSGIRSDYYFDGRKLTLDPRGAHLMGKAFLAMLRGFDVEAIGGPALGAVPIVTAVAMTSHPGEKPLNGFIVRKEAKDHGTGQLIEGPSLEPGSRVAIVDDTCSTGDSLLHAIDAAQARGCEVEVVLVLLDRRQGGRDAFKKRGLKFGCLLEADSDGEIHPAKDLDLNHLWNSHREDRAVVWPADKMRSSSTNGAVEWQDSSDVEELGSMKGGRVN